MIKLFRFSLIKIFIFLVLILSYSSVFAAIKTIPNEEIKGLDIGVFNAKIISQESNVFKISFDVVNNDVPQAGLEYTLKLIKDTKDKGQFLVDSYTPKDSFSISSKSRITKEFVYNAPATISGDYSMAIFLSNESGNTIGLNSVGNVKLTSKENGLQIIPESCYLTVDSEKDFKEQPKYNVLEGIDISSSENLILSCDASNSSNVQVNAIPQYETHLRSMNGEIVSHEGGDNNPIIFKEGETKKISVILPKANKPQSYDVKIILKNNEIISNSIIVHYVIQGSSATIVRASLDKDYYEKGDDANIFIFWAPSADSFVRSRIGKGTENKNLTLISSIKNNLGFKCIKNIESNLAEISSSHKANIPIKIISKCKDPVLSLKIKDETGNILDEKEFAFKSVNAPSNNMIIYIIVIVLMVGVVTVYFINLKKNKNEIFKQNESNTNNQ